MTGLTKNKTLSAESKDEFKLQILHQQICQTSWQLSVTRGVKWFEGWRRCQS